MGPLRRRPTAIEHLAALYFDSDTAPENSLQMNSVVSNTDPRLEIRSGRRRRCRRSTLCDQSEFRPDQAVGRFEPSPRGSSGSTPTPSVAIQTYYGLSSTRRKMAGRTGDQRSKATIGALEMFQQCSPISMGGTDFVVVDLFALLNSGAPRERGGN